MPTGSLTWHDLTEGDQFVSGGRTITEADVVGFAGLTGDSSPVHLDQEFAAKTDFGQRIAHGLLGLSYAHGLIMGSGLFRDCALAFLGMSDWSFKAPILLGDTIHVAYRITGLRSRRTRCDQGIATFEIEVRNQHDHIVQRGSKAILMRITEPENR
ncbi:MaoC/PaaZ C-terminal domain-containing protein [Mycobacterium sp. NPDC003449]